MSTNDILFSERCRPQTIDDLTLPKRDIAFLQAMNADKHQLKNLLFHGRPGVGKTSAARILVKDMDLSFTELPEKARQSRAALVAFVEPFFSSISFDGNHKVLVINEADSLRKAEQTYLLNAIEQSADNGRFIMTANDPGKLLEPLRSRLTRVNFDILPSDRHQVIERLKTRYEAIIAGVGWFIPKDRLSQIVHIHFPDLRSVANELEREAMSQAVLAA